MAWRVRLGASAATIGWLVMGDSPAFLLAALGFGACGLIVALASILASIETRVVRLRRASERRK